MVQVGIIDNRFIGPTCTEVLCRLDGVNVMALCDDSLVVVQEHTDALHIPHTYDNVEVLLARSGPQVVHNCTSNHLHAGINRQIPHVGLHVSSEKSLCMTPDETRELETLTQRTKVVHGVSFIYCWFTMVQQTVDMVRNGSVDSLFAVQGSYL